MNNRIKEILSERSITAKGLADMIGISSVSLYNIINGKQEASVNTLKAIADSLGVPFWQLFVSPTEIQREDQSFMALVKDGSEYYHATTLLELEGIVKHLKESKKD